MTLKFPIHDSPGVDTALPEQVAEALGTTVAGLAQMRYRGTGPKFCRVGMRRVIYRWSDVQAYLEASTIQRTDEQPTRESPKPVAAFGDVKRHHAVTNANPTRPRKGQ